MANYFSKKLALAAVGAALSLVALEANPAQAILTYNYSFTLPSFFTAAPGAVGSGSFSFDETLFIPDVPFQFVPVTNFSLNLLGVNFTPADVFVGTTGVAVSFVSGATPTAAFQGINTDLDPTNFPANYPLAGISLLADIYAIADRDFNPVLGPIAYQQVAPTSVPEPGTVGGLIVLGLGWLLKKQQALTSHHAELTD